METKTKILLFEALFKRNARFVELMDSWMHLGHAIPIEATRAADGTGIQKSHSHCRLVAEFLDFLKVEANVTNYFEWEVCRKV